MSAAVKHQAAETADLKRIADLFGGARVLGHRVTGPLDAHEFIARGLPGEALVHFVERSAILQKPASMEKALGMSLRTFQRRKDAPAKRLSQEQSGRTWKFAEIVAQATTVFGSQAAAEQWLEAPAIGLEQRRPLDLLATPAGTRLVEDHLERMRTGVYA